MTFNIERVYFRQDNIKVGLEATGHYSDNILNFLNKNGFNTYLINPLQTNLYVKGQSLRKTKTDKLDAHIIATMLISDNLKPYIPVSYHISELKSLTRHRFRLVKENSKFKSSLALLYELPSAKEIAEYNLKHLTHLLYDNSNKKFDRDKAIEIRELVKKSIGLICMNDITFNNFKERKLSEGKHYRVTLGHVAKKLVCVIYYLLKTNSKYESSKVA